MHGILDDDLSRSTHMARVKRQRGEHQCPKARGEELSRARRLCVIWENGPLHTTNTSDTALKSRTLFLLHSTSNSNRRSRSSPNLILMVSARPPPAPARGRIPYPSAASYLPGDTAHSPAYLRDAEPVHPTTSRDSDKERAQGLKTWWKSFRDRPEPIPRAPGVFGIPLDESVRYASVQISTQDQDGSLHIWGWVLSSQPRAC
mgnify:CR=1 FL=1